MKYTYAKQEERKRQLLEVSCRQCHAPAGEHCRIMGGGRAMGTARPKLSVQCSHQSRWIAAGLMELQR